MSYKKILLKLSPLRLERFRGVATNKSKNEMENFTKIGNKILGAALNYSDTPGFKKPESPIVFCMPTSSYITEGQDIVVS